MKLIVIAALFGAWLVAGNALAADPLWDQQLPPRSEWAKQRDAAGVKKGYIKTSMGDLIDEFRAQVGGTEKATVLAKWTWLKVLKAFDDAAKKLGNDDVKPWRNKVNALVLKWFRALLEYETKLTAANPAPTAESPMAKFIGLVRRYKGTATSFATLFSRGNDALKTEINTLAPGTVP